MRNWIPSSIGLYFHFFPIFANFKQILKWVPTYLKRISLDGNTSHGLPECRGSQMNWKKWTRGPTFLVSHFIPVAIFRGFWCFGANFQTQTQGVKNFFWGLKTIFMAKVGPNAVNLAIAEMIGQLLTFTTHPSQQLGSTLTTLTVFTRSSQGFKNVS